MLTLATSGIERVKLFYDDKSAEGHLPPSWSKAPSEYFPNSDGLKGHA